MMELVNDIYRSAKDGSSSNLKSLLSSFKSKAKERSKLIEHKTKDGDQITTPLIIASRNGHIECVEILLSYDADIEARGTVKFDDESSDYEEVSALWAAAAKGAMDIVKLLIKKGANVNARTKTNSTPLRATAYDGRLDIVSYLVEHGADVNAKNDFESTSLMVACYNGHRSVVNYLIDKGAKIDAQDKEGKTALYIAAKQGHLDIVKDLIVKGASQLPNNLGLTPLLSASNNCKIEMVEYFIARPDCSKLDEIHSLELLGATIANERNAYDIDKAYEFMMRGMKKRYEGDKCVIKKAILPPIQAYQNRVECQTEDELNGIQNDPHAIHMEGLLVRERVLGPKNTELRFPIRYRGAVYADSVNFKLCIALWKHAMDIGQQNDLAVVYELELFAGIFCQMIQLKVFPSFADVYDILEHAVIEYEKVNQKIQKAAENKSIESLIDDLESVIHRSLYLLTIFGHLNLTESAEKLLQQLLYKYLCMNPRTRQGKTLVHLAVSYATPTDDKYTYMKNVLAYPCYKTTKLLLQTGAQVATVDNKGNTPLHTVVMTKPKHKQQETVEKIISALYNSGVHEDLTNAAGKTALEVSATKELKQLLLLKRRIVLKCLAARAIKHYQLRFTGLVPKSLEMFITAH